tara:strand:+ start:590 stop:1315 length:726 start_codon:yes stop_codon:yes gene_type:complete
MDLLFSCQEIDCDGCNICVVKKHIKNSYSESDFESIINSDTMLELFLREIFPKDESFIKMFDFLKSLRKTNIPTSNVASPNIDDKINKIIGKKTSYQKIRYVATDYDTKIKQMSMIDNLFERLENKQSGISKTYFLKSISKDNKSGRKDFDAIVSRAIMDGIIVRVGRKYYLRKNMMIHENNFHRKVYHVIYDNQPISSSSILTKINYRNSKGRKKLLQILKLMSEDDLIEYSSNKWFIKE